MARQVRLQDGELVPALGQGTWNLDDPVQVTALVRRHLLVGILADPATQ